MWACACLIKQMLQSSKHELVGALLMARAWCLHHVGLTCLPLANRCLDVDTQQLSASCPTLLDFIPAWCAAVGQLLVSTMGTANGLTKGDLACLVDLYDGRLWHFMGSCLSAEGMNIGLPTEAVQAADCMQQIVCQLAGIPLISLVGMQQVPATAEQPCYWYLERAQHAVITTMIAPQPSSFASAQQKMASNSLISALLGCNQHVPLGTQQGVSAGVCTSCLGRLL